MAYIVNEVVAEERFCLAWLWKEVYCCLL